MIAHRFETRPNEPSVKFYRTIAVTFLIIAVGLFGLVILLTTKNATITILAKNDASVVNIALTISPHPASDATATIAGTVSSSIQAFTATFQPTGTQTTDAVATGNVIIYNQQNTTQALVKTTRLLTPNGILFRLKNNITIPAGGQTTALAYADSAGAAGNIGPTKFTIPGLPVDKQKLVYAENKETFTGGVKSTGVISEADLTSAKNSYAEKLKSNIMNGLSNTDGVAIFITNQNVASDQPVGTPVETFNLSGTSTVIIANFNTDELNRVIKKELETKLDAEAEKVLTVGQKPMLSLASFDEQNNSLQLSARQDLYVTLDPDAAKLAPTNFINKSKDEITRYLLGLGHVAGTEVKFSPSWMPTAPGSADRIKIMVKNVK